MQKIYTDEENIAWAKSLPAKLCSACMIIKSENQVLMVKANYKDHWTFPGGVVDENEAPKAAALRETHEEIGLKLNPPDCRPFSIVYTASGNGYPDRFSFAFLTITKNQPEATSLAVPNEEIDEVKWVNLNQVAQMANNRASYQAFEKQLLSGNESTVTYSETSHF